MRVAALVDDLMDRSRVVRAVPGTTFASDPAAVGDADVVIVDLARHGAQLGQLRSAHPQARLVAFGPHVDAETLAAARRAGADRVLARSQFFRDPAGALAPGSDPVPPSGGGGSAGGCGP
jgi:hypothetical protein